MVTLEAAGIPTVVLCTEPFVKAADEQWAALAFPKGSVVAVGHPLGSMPLDQVLAEAEKAVARVLDRLVQGSDARPEPRPELAEGVRVPSDGLASAPALSRRAEDSKERDAVAAPRAQIDEEDD